MIMKRVLISGGSRGIGAALVRAFCRRGDRVAFLYRQSHDAAKALAAETGAFAIACDVSSAAEVEAGAAAAAEALGGPIEIFVGNAVGSTNDVFKHLPGIARRAGNKGRHEGS